MQRNIDEIPYRILLVDDELGVGDLLSDFLLKRGYEVFFTNQSSKAVDYVKRIRPHVVLLDVVMEEMDGLEVLKQIIKIDPVINVIMVSGYFNDETGKEALKLGAVDYISKPVNFEYLNRSIKTKLESM